MNDFILSVPTEYKKSLEAFAWGNCAIAEQAQDGKSSLRFYKLYDYPSVNEDQALVILDKLHKLGIRARLIAK